MVDPAPDLRRAHLGLIGRAGLSGDQGGLDALARQARKVGRAFWGRGRHGRGRRARKV